MSITFDFTGRTVAVTGAGQGIGLAIARRFQAAGAKVAVLDRNASVLEAEWGPGDDRVRVVTVDIADARAVRDEIDAIVTWAGSIDVLVNNAGIARDRVVWKLSDEDWQTVLDVHLNGTFNTTRAAVSHMRAAGHGRIINVTSYTGMHGNVGQSNYAAAKGGIIAFTKAVAKETARTGITVNAISPNAATPMVQAVGEEKLAEMAAIVPVGRFAEPDEMATAVGYLAADESGYVTGVVLPVDGGLAM